MPSSSSKSARICATCQYWLGARELTKSGNVLYDYEGVCSAAGSPYKGKTVRGSQSFCSHWQKWIFIK
jgi:hypothetical protein